MRGARRAEVAALLAIVALGAALRLARPGADVPLAVERTDAPIQDAFWYLEAASGPAEGLPRDLEPAPVYDPPVWVQGARLWLSCVGVSLGSVQTLGALVALATLLLVWRLARAALGPVEALVAAAVLATLYPFVWLSRTTLVYGPGALALTAAAALAWAAGPRPPRDRGWLEGAAWLALSLSAWATLELSGATPAARAGAAAAGGVAFAGWLACRRSSPDLARRAALYAAAWAIVVATTLALRPPVAAAAGGLALLHVARARRPLRAGLLVGAALLLGLVVVAALDPGQVRVHTLDRLRRYVSPEALTPDGLALRALRLGGDPRGDSGSGFVSLAPGAALAAAVGVLAALRGARPAHDGRRALLALLGGWAAMFLAGAVASDYRPLRYFVVLCPPLAVFAGTGVVWLLSAARRDLAAPPARTASLTAGACAALWGALAAPHALEALAGPRPLEDLVLAAAAGAIALVALLRLRPRPSPAAARLGGGLLLVAAAAPGAVVCSLDLAAPRWLTRDANRAAAAALAPGASLVGPHASVLALGHGVIRRRAAWIDVSPARVEDTLARLRGLGATHVALGVEQAASSDFVAALSGQGAAPALVGVFLPRGTPVLLLRLPWSREAGYRLSPFEERRLHDADAQAPSPVASEDDPALLLARVRALALQGRPDQAGAVLSAASIQLTSDELLMASARRALRSRGLR